MGRKCTNCLRIVSGNFTQKADRGDFMVCCEWSAVKTMNLEIGIRRGIGKRITKENHSILSQYAQKTNNDIPQDINNEWWYVIEHSSTFNAEDIKRTMDKYLSYFDD